MRQIKLTKIEDFTNGEHKNNINKGYTKKGLELKLPTIGEPYILESRKYFSTSKVLEILDDTTFKTINSIYKIEVLDHLTIKEFFQD